jgi:hypothetical protein
MTYARAIIRLIEALIRAIWRLGEAGCAAVEQWIRR